MKLEFYKNKEWLYQERIEKRRTLEDIASQCGVSRKSIEHFAKKFNIGNPTPEYHATKIVNCKRCGCGVEKRIKHIKAMKRYGTENYHCDSCLKEYHKERSVGENNPNFEGGFHGELPSEWSPEKWKEVIKKQRETKEKNGTFPIKEKNPRWTGEGMELPCTTCGESRYFLPNIVKLIKAEKRQPFCSNGCALINAQKVLLEKERTSIELKMAEAIKKQGFEFIEQYNVDGFFADFYIPEFNLIIECDGDYWHKRPETMERDKRKNACYKQNGYKFIRFWESEIHKDLQGCIDRIYKCLKEKRSEY